MSEQQATDGRAVEAGTRVGIRFTLLQPGERAPGVPEDTAQQPYVVRARGILLGAGRLGERAAIRTPIGRTLEGELEVVEPADRHSFGRPTRAQIEAREAICELKRKSFR